MANKICRGDSAPVAKVVNFTPLLPQAGQIFTAWCNGKPANYVTLLGDGAAGVAAGLALACQSAAFPEFGEFLANAAGNTLTLSAATPGVPFEVTFTTSGYISVAETVMGVGPTNEVHEIQLLGTYTAGTWTATYNFGAGNVTTAAIAYNATAAAVQSALAALAGVGAGNVLVTGGPGPTAPWFVTWLGTFAGTAVTPGTINGSGLTGAGSVNISTQQPGAPVTDCLQQIQLFATSGTFTLTFLGQTTTSLFVGSSATSIQSALQALSSIGSGNCTVVGEGASGTVNANNFFVHFTGALAGQSLPVITLNGGGLSGSATTQIVQQGAASSQAAYQFVDLTSGPVFPNTTFTLTFNGRTTTSISTMPGGPGYVSAAVMSALQAIGCPVVTVYGSDWLTGVASTTFCVKITGYAPQAAPVLTATIASFTPTITVLSNGLAAQNDIQKIWVAASGGTFTLTEAAQTTNNIAYNAASGTVQTRIQTDLAATIVACTVTGSGTQASPWVVTVTNPASTVVAQMTGNPAGLSGGGSITEVTHGQAGTSEVQTITAAAGVNAGTFTLSFMGPVSIALNWNATNAQVQSALVALSSINTVTVTGPAGGPWVVTWSGAQAAAQQPLLFADGSLLTGATTSLVTLATATWSAGPLHYDDPANWQPYGIPNAGDSVYFIQGSTACLYGLDQASTFTVNTGTNLGTWTKAALQNGQIVQVSSTTTLPAPLAAGTNYYLVNVNRDARTFQLSTTLGGSPITWTTTGTGTHTIAASLAYLEFNSSFSGDTGLPYYNSLGYVEYRTRYLHFMMLTIANGGTEQIVIGTGDGNGAGKIQLDTDISLALLKIIATGSSDDQGANAVIWKGSNAGNTLNLINGDFGTALFPGDVANLASITQTGGKLFLGPGTTVTGPINKTGGSIIIDGATVNGVVLSQ